VPPFRTRIGLCHRHTHLPGSLMPSACPSYICTGSSCRPALTVPWVAPESVGPAPSGHSLLSKEVSMSPWHRGTGHPSFQHGFVTSSSDEALVQLGAAVL